MTGKNIATDMLINRYMDHLRCDEKSKATLDKYRRDIRKFLGFSGGQEVTKALTIAYKKHLDVEGYQPTSINSMLAAVNGFLSFCGWEGCCVGLLKIQRKVFCDQQEELTKGDYKRLLGASKDPKHERINMVLRTICSTGIRVSELRFITVDALRDGQAIVELKGKVRTVFLHKKLQKYLWEYVRKHGLESGPIFITRTGRPLNRSNIWREMKALCKAACVEPKKVFPHNLRHLFARSFYALDKDIAKLADILGHSNIETTRIYILTTGTDHARQIDLLDLVS